MSGDQTGDAADLDLFGVLSGLVQTSPTSAQDRRSTITFTSETVDEDRQLGDRGIPGLPLR